MKTINYKSEGVCAKEINLKIDDENKIHDLTFEKGCPGNLVAIGLLCENRDATEVANLLENVQCGSRPTSCTSQLAKAIKNS